MQQTRQLHASQYLTKYSVEDIPELLETHFTHSAAVCCASDNISCVVTGMKDGQQVRFSGEGDQSPGLEAGDVVIVLDEKEHNVFRRHGIDLLMQMEISLTEALCGFVRAIQTLDDRSLVISTLPGKTTCAA